MPKETNRAKLFNDLYEIKGVIGRGESSVVYKAIDVYNGGIEVALKVLTAPKSTEDFLKLKHRLRNEALCMVSTNNKFVLKLIDFQVLGEVCYLVTEFAPYLDLRFYRELLGKPIPGEQLRIFLKQILIALEHVHGLGIIHRDVRPDNILVFNESLVKLGDFSNAISHGEPFSAEDAMKAPGSLHYLAPELITGQQPTQRSDIYSLGVTFVELARDKNPFEDVPLIASLNEREKLASDNLLDIPFELRNVLRLMIQVDPIFRPKTAKEALSYLENPELAENKVRNLDEILKREDSPEKDNRTVVLSPEEVELRMGKAATGNMMSKVRHYFEKICKLTSVAVHKLAQGTKLLSLKLGLKKILLIIAGLLAILLIAVFGWSRDVSSLHEGVETELRQMQLIDLPDGVFVGRINGVLPMVDSLDVAAVKTGGRFSLVILSDIQSVSTGPLSEESVIISAISHQIKLSNLRASDKYFYLDAFNLETGQTGKFKFKKLRDL